ncbi:MAG: hypothetical protein PHN80_10825 [Hespellia sp.]|nr:hypothetical protein [Hespellia sp.]
MAVTKEEKQMAAETQQEVEQMPREHHAKDHANKYLEDYPDVFADIFNVLLFQKEMIRPEDNYNGSGEGR